MCCSDLLLLLCSIFSTEAGQNVSYDYPSHIQCYWQLPHCIKPIFEMGIFVTLGLSGTYYIYIYIYMFVMRKRLIHTTLGWFHTKLGV